MAIQRRRRRSRRQGGVTETSYSKYTETDIAGCSKSWKGEEGQGGTELTTLVLLFLILGYLRVVPGLTDNIVTVRRMKDGLVVLVSLVSECALEYLLARQEQREVNAYL
ncbi:hypothetical protein NW765_011284 [Fusarium oxysporum]|nr:hypothetical protein NW765_011284 [Fusarium oxysporum]